MSQFEFITPPEHNSYWEVSPDSSEAPASPADPDAFNKARIAAGFDFTAYGSGGDIPYPAAPPAPETSLEYKELPMQDGRIILPGTL
jgi:hypothetical protein